MSLKLIDVRDQMPNYTHYQTWQRANHISGIAIHHSTTIDNNTGLGAGDALSLFNYQVKEQGWLHGCYNYIITTSGVIEYALDDQIPAYHAGFDDPTNTWNLEKGQYWNNHYLAICLIGWFSDNRPYHTEMGIKTIPNNHTYPNQQQLEALMALIDDLCQQYNIPADNIRGHRELAGHHTQCPGLNFDLVHLRQQVTKLTHPLTASSSHPEPARGEHVIVLPNPDDYLTAALGYIWKFQPDVSFNPQVALGRWKYITAVGEIPSDLLAAYKQHGAVVVEHVQGDVEAIQQTLDNLVTHRKRFLS